MRRTLALAVGGVVSAGLLAMGATAAPAAENVSGTSGHDTTSASMEPCPSLVAHRGGFETPPNTNENSMAAFERAADIGVWAIETDVWFTKDMVPVVMHDETLDRTTDGTGKVSDYTYAQLRQFRLNNGERIPTLKQVLELIKKRDIWGFIEYKDADDPAYFEAYYQALMEVDANVYGAGFSTELMEWLHKEDPSLPLMWFGKRSGSIPIPVTPADVPEGADPGLINYLITPDLVAQMNAAGKDVNVWFNTVSKGDDPAGNSLGPGWEGVTQAGVTWVSTDWPDKYLSWAQSTNDCAAPPPKVSKATCLTLPKKLKAGRTYRVMRKGCTTSADRPVKLTVKGNAATKKGSNRIKVRRDGRTKLVLTAKGRSYSEGGESWQSYTTFKKTQRYRVGSVSGRG